MRNWSIHLKIGLAVGALALVAVAVGLESLHTMKSYGEAATAMERASRRANLGERINGHVLSVVMDSRGIYMSEDKAAAEKFAQPLLAGLKRLEADLQDWMALAPPGQQAEYQAAAEAARSFIAFRTELVRLARDDGPRQARAFGDNDANRANRKTLNDRLQMLAAANGEAVGQLRAHMERFHESSMILIAAMVGGSLGLGLPLVIWLIRRQVTAPLRRLTEALARMAAGDLSAAIPAGSRHDEVGEMAAALRVLRDKAQEAETLRAAGEQERLRGERDKVAALRAMADKVESDTNGALNRVAEQTDRMAGEAERMAGAALEVTRNSREVSAAAAQALANAQGVAGALQQLNASVEEITRQVGEAAHGAAQAVAGAGSAQTTIATLVDAVMRIDEVTRMIRDIASRTQMLALNATIEAQRAGEAGKGFAVVAEEVKALATQTAAATETIGTQIHAIQASTHEAAEAVEDITQVVQRLGTLSSGIAHAMEEQGGATAEIARNITQTAHAAGEVSSRIAEVSAEAAQTESSASTVRESSRDLADSMQALRASVIRTVRTATGDVDRRTAKRQTLQQDCELEMDGDCTQCTLIDICEDGAAVAMPPVPVHPGQRLKLKLDAEAPPVPARVHGLDSDRVRLTFEHKAPVAIAAE